MGEHTTESFGARVRQSRKDAGLSVEKLRDRVKTLVPARYVPGTKTFYRIETGDVAEASVDGILVVGIANACGVRISALSQAVADENEGLGDLLTSSLPWITAQPSLFDELEVEHATLLNAA